MSMEKERLPFDWDNFVPGCKTEDAVGREILCEDGAVRLVETIEPAGKFGFLTINNEALVNIMSLVEQLTGEPVSEEFRNQFNEIAKSFSLQYTNNGGNSPWDPFLKNLNPNQRKLNRKERRAQLKLLRKN